MNILNKQKLARILQATVSLQIFKTNSKRHSKFNQDLSAVDEIKPTEL